MRNLTAILTTLRRRDPHNQTLAIFLILLLARVSKTYKGLQAYTMWNCTAVLLNYILRPQGWERPLFCNSLSIFAAFRTASADAHADFVNRSGKSEAVYWLGDTLIHTLPPVVLGISMIRHNRFARPQHGALALFGQIFFAYSQAGKMDLGDIYVPHDVSFAWVAVLFGQMLAPTVINNVIKRRWKRALVAFLVVMSPYLLKKIGLRRIINKRTIAKNRLIGKQDDGFFTSDGDGGGDGRSTTVVCPHCGSQVKRTRGLTLSKSLMDISSMV